MLLGSPICLTKSRALPFFEDNHGLKLYTIESLLASGGHSDLAKACKYGLDDVTPDRDLAMLMLTSGSTGNAKAVQLTHEQVLAAVAGKASVRPLPSSQPFMNWIGLDHVASLVEIHIQALWLGVDQIHVSAADVVSSPQTFLDLLSRHQVSRSFAPNFFLARLVSAVSLDVGCAKKMWDLSKLVILASGGEANDVDTCNAASVLLQRYGAPRNVITPGFGMTETCAGAIFNLDCPRYDVDNRRNVCALGKCMQGIDMRITRPGTSIELAAPDEPGDLEVCGPVVFDGYYRNSDATADAFTPDGWFRTGDQAMIDSNGHLNLTGRTKDTININGIKYLAADIQILLEKNLGTLVSRLIVFPSRTAHTEKVTIAYIPKDWPIRDIIEIENLAVQTCIHSTASYPVIFALQVSSVSSLPMSTLGKISRAKMRSLFEAGTFGADATWYAQAVKFAKPHAHREIQAPVSQAEALLMADLADIRPMTPGTMGVDTSFFELGFTSMDLIMLKHRTDTRLATEVPIVLIMKNPTARSLAAAIHINVGDADTKEATPNAHDYDPVVTFRTSGTKTPLWLVHPGVGEVLVFVGLSQRMSEDDRPMFALRARGFEAGQERFISITEVVDTYVNSIRQRQPHGPYALAGYSYGTMLAFEMAKKIDAEDGFGTVQFLGSFNLPPHIKPRMRQLNWNMCLLHLAFFLGITTEAQTENTDEELFRCESRSEALTHILRAADQTRFEQLGLSEEGLIRWADVAYGLQSMAVDYEPDGEVCAIDVFHAAPLKVAARSREEWVRDHLSRWADFSRTSPRFHEVGGAHYTMIGPDHVHQFSEILKAALGARGI